MGWRVQKFQRIENVGMMDKSHNFQFSGHKLCFFFIFHILFNYIDSSLLFGVSALSQADLCKYAFTYNVPDVVEMVVSAGRRGLEVGNILVEVFT